MAKSRDLYQKENEPERPVNSGINYLLAIGIDAYKNCPVLSNAVKDASDLATVLEKKYGFLPENMSVITNEAATEHRIFSEFRNLIQQVKPDDNVLIFFSGHGHYDEDFKQGYWIPVDARPGAIGDYIPNSEISTTIRAIPSRHTLMIADACFSGSLFGESRAVFSKETPSIYHQKVGAIPSRWGLASGRNEIVADGAPGENSPFSENLIYFLESYIDTPFTVSELVQYVKTATANNSEQTPIGSPLRNVGDKGGEYVFFPTLTKRVERLEAVPQMEESSPSPVADSPPLALGQQIKNWIKNNSKALTLVALGALFWGFWSSALYLVIPALAVGIIAVIAIFNLQGRPKIITTFGISLIVMAEFILSDRKNMFEGGFLERTHNHQFLWFSLGLICFSGFLYFFLKKHGPGQSFSSSLPSDSQPLSARFLNWAKYNYRMLLLIVAASLFWGLWHKLLFLIVPALILAIIGATTLFGLKGRTKITYTVLITLAVIVDFVFYDWHQMFQNGEMLGSGISGFWNGILARTQNFEFMWFGLGVGCFVGFLYFFFEKRASSFS